MRVLARITVIAALGWVLAAPAPAAAQDVSAASQRARQLEVFEELLTRTVQEHVSSTVNAGIEAERLGDLDGDGQPDAPAEDPVVVKVGAAVGAHGLYIAGYGVLFSIQQPQVSVLPRAFAVYLEEPRYSFRFAPGAEAPPGQGAAGMLQFRASMLERQLAEMERFLDLQVSRDPDSSQVGAITAQIEALRQNLADVRVQFAELTTEPGTEAAQPQPVSAPPAGTERRVRRERAPGEDQEPWGLYREMVERQRSVGDILETNYRRMRAAVSNAAIDTLAHYGAVIKGLGDDERLSVLVLPPNPWNVARRHGVEEDQAEYVISVRYRDIRDFDDGKIDLVEFHSRALIHDRLGLELHLEGPH